MRFFGILAMSIALLLTLVGNTAAVGFCLSENNFSFAGANTCVPAETHCDCGQQNAGDPSPCDHAEGHREIVVELDDEIRLTVEETGAPPAEALPLFFEIFSARLHPDSLSAAPPIFPAVSEPIPAPPDLAGTRPMLA